MLHNLALRGYCKTMWFDLRAIWFTILNERNGLAQGSLPQQGTHAVIACAIAVDDHCIAATLLLSHLSVFPIQKSGNGR